MARILITVVMLCLLAGAGSLVGAAASVDADVPVTDAVTDGHPATPEDPATGHIADDGPATPESLLVDDVTDEHPAGLYLDYFADDEQQCDVHCAVGRFREGNVAGRYVHSDTDTPNLGVTGSYWFRLVVRNSTTETDWIAEAAAPYLDDVDMYVLHESGAVEEQHSGDMMPTGERPVRDRNIALPFRLGPGETATLLFRVTNQGPVTFPLDIETRDAFNAESAEENLVYGLYFGILLGVILYNLIIYLVIRDVSHVLYVLYASAFTVTMATTFGFSAVYFWPDNPWWINRAVPVSVLGTGILVTLFSRSFLKLPRGGMRDRTMIAIIVVLIGLMPVAFEAPFGIAVRIIYVTAVACIFWLLYLGIEQVLHGNRSARYFMLAWVVLLLSVMAFLFTKLGILPSVFVTEFGILIGSALEAILLSIALAHRFAVIRDENARIQAEANAELEKRVEERTRELDRALQARSEFLATVSHEIRTPMNGVLGITELLLDTPLTDRQKEYAQIIQGSGRTLLTIINDVLDYSKIEAGKMSLEQVTYRIRDVLNAAAQIFRAEAERKKLDFATSIDPDVPEQIIGDPVRLQQVLNNLLSNAIKFTDEGEIRMTVHREDDGKLTFAVHDTGIGIDAQVQPRLFESFNQGDQSMTRRFGGTGLGLAISRRLIDLMGGSISFESDVGRGTTFYFTIPVRTTGTGAWPRVPAEPRNAAGSLHMLVVDDNDVNLQVAAGLLAKLGHRVETVSNGRDAIDRVFSGGEPFDIVFMDCEMPDMDGFAATREIRRREQFSGGGHTPVIALTAHAFAEKIEACHAAGMDDHLAKPMNLHILEQTIARVRKPLA